MRVAARLAHLAFAMRVAVMVMAGVVVRMAGECSNDGGAGTGQRRDRMRVTCVIVMIMAVTGRGTGGG